MANPFDSFTKQWLDFCTSMQNANPQASAQQFGQQSAKGWADLWQMPASYWQTVASIHAERARYAQDVLAKAPQQMAALAQVKSFPELIGALTLQQGNAMAEHAEHLATVDSHRIHLWNDWCNLAQRNMPKQPAAQQPAQPSATPKAAPQAKPTASSFTPAPAPAPVKAQVQPVVQVAPAPAPVKVAAPAPQPVAVQPLVVSPTLLNPTMPDEIPLLSPSISNGTTVSSTANSVMRASAGSSMAAAAARRSVVARRQSRRRSPR